MNDCPHEYVRTKMTRNPQENGTVLLAHCEVDNDFCPLCGLRLKVTTPEKPHGNVKVSEIEKKIAEVDSALLKHFKGSEKNRMAWMHEKNVELGGITPAQFALRDWAAYEEFVEKMVVKAGGLNESIL